MSNNTGGPGATRGRKSSGWGGGSVTLVGAGLYDLEGFFAAGLLSGERTLHLHSMRLGDVIDGSESELEGRFFCDPNDHTGVCYYTLEEVDGEEGVMVLTIKAKDKEQEICRLEGLSEGFGEAFVTNKKGHLHVHPSEHNNLVRFEGDSSISNISFELDDHIVSKGEPFDGIHWDHDEQQQDKENHLTIDVKAGRHNSEDCGSFYRNSVGDETARMMHTLGGSGDPDKLNFAFTGTLYIDDDSYDVCIGQGHHGAYDNWHLASFSLNAAKNHKSGTLGNYKLEPSGSHTFKVKKA